MRDFVAAGVPHRLVNAGDYGQCNSELAVSGAAKVIEETARFWGHLPFDRYVIFSIFRRAGGGLEHMNSMLLTTNSDKTKVDARWSESVCHEYFHAVDAKRLRPAELASLDHENPPRTSGLWVSEGLPTWDWRKLTTGR